MIIYINQKRILDLRPRETNTYHGLKWKIDDEFSHFGYYHVEVTRCSNNELWVGLYYPTREEINAKSVQRDIKFYLDRGMK